MQRPSTTWKLGVAVILVLVGVALLTEGYASRDLAIAVPFYLPGGIFVVIGIGLFLRFMLTPLGKKDSPLH